MRAIKNLVGAIFFLLGMASFYGCYFVLTTKTEDIQKMQFIEEKMRPIYYSLTGSNPMKINILGGALVVLTILFFILMFEMLKNKKKLAV